MKSRLASYHIGAAVLGALIGMSVTAINISWHWRVPEGWVHTGFLQSDQNTYTATVREIFERGNGLCYAAPYEIRDDTPAVFFHVPFVILGWLWRATGLGFPAVWELFRVISAAAMFWAIALVVRRYFPEKRWFVFAFLFIAFGGGVAWLVTLCRIGARAIVGAAASAPLIEEFMNVEQPYFWWFPNIFRNVVYPLELFYHVFFFVSIYCLLTGRWRVLTASFALACLSGVFVGAELGLVLAVFCVVEYAVWRNKNYLQPLVLVALVAVPFIIYYVVFLPSYPVGANLSAQHRHFPHELIPVHKYIQAYGLMLLLLPCAFASARYRRSILGAPEGRLLLVWVAVMFLLMNNQWFVGGGGIQPPRFSRGYLFFPLALLVLLWLRGLPALRPFSAQNVRSVLLTLLLVFAVPDNALFLYAVAARQPHPGILTVQRETKEVLDFLKAQPGRLHILCPDTKLGVLIPAHTPHNSLIGDMMATPFWEEKRADLDRFLREGRVSSVLEKYSIDTIIVPAEWRYHFGQIVGDVRVRYQNAVWIVYEVARW